MRQTRPRLISAMSTVFERLHEGINSWAARPRFGLLVVDGVEDGSIPLNSDGQRGSVEPVMLERKMYDMNGRIEIPLERIGKVQELNSYRYSALFALP